MQGRERMVRTFTVHMPKATAMTPPPPPSVRYSESAENISDSIRKVERLLRFADFNTGENRVDIGGVRAVIYRWQDDRIDVWVPFSAKSGPVVVYRGATRPNSDGSCCCDEGDSEN